MNRMDVLLWEYITKHPAFHFREQGVSYYSQMAFTLLLA